MDVIRREIRTASAARSAGAPGPRLTRSSTGWWSSHWPPCGPI